MKILIINGPNLNLLGTRETSIYGNITFEHYLKKLRASFPEIVIDYFQSNIEGEIIDSIQKASHLYNCIVLNAGGYSHTSVSIGDAVRASEIDVVEVHISNIFSREDFRHKSFIAPYVAGVITGFGLDSYMLAVEYLVKRY